MIISNIFLAVIFVTFVYEICVYILVAARGIGIGAIVRACSLFEELSGSKI